MTRYRREQKPVVVWQSVTETESGVFKRACLVLVKLTAGKPKHCHYEDGAIEN